MGSTIGSQGNGLEIIIDIPTPKRGRNNRISKLVFIKQKGFNSVIHLTKKFGYRPNDQRGY